MPLYHRRSIRLSGYDYAQAGEYFITICVQNREHLFGEIINEEMILNDAGKMIEKWYVELSNKFPDIVADVYCVMPNHFHAIIVNVGTVGATLRGCPMTSNNICPMTSNNICPMTSNTLGERDNKQQLSNKWFNTLGEHDNNQQLGEMGKYQLGDGNVNILGEHIGSPLHHVVGRFKTMTTNEYIRGVKTKNRQPFDGKLWQRNYYEHIIRNEISYHHIAEYIENNPKKRKDDQFWMEM